MIKKKIKIAVIPAAGKGSRIAELPLTKILPKPMLPLLNKPIVEHIINWLKDIGIKKIYLIVSFKEEIFKEYFGDGSEFGVEINYIDCPDTQNIGGLADGIYLVRKIIREPFMVVLGDDFTIIESYKAFTEKFFEKKALVLEAVVEEKNVEALKRSCSVKIAADGKILDIVEKPEKPKWKIRGCGIYVFDPIVFDFINKTPVNPKKGVKDITKTIQIMAQKTGRVFGLSVKSNININTLADLRQATLLLLKEKSK